MRHNYKGRKLGTDYSHTKAMKKSLVCALFLNDRVRTIKSRGRRFALTSIRSSRGRSAAICTPAVWPLPSWATRNWCARFSRRSRRACSKIAPAAIRAS